ncbi:MAG: thiamine pyrophosphate-dependent dehydrogenase E1 component subunit alpha [Verrucomicrobiota bacterium]|nr:thiamine pyrophosphate-dependent dehydrogenase E1 component subunit alpha [Verrucomicrobiota bacterium]
MVHAAANGLFLEESVSLRERFLRAFRFMLLSRILDEKLASLYRAGKIPGGGVYLGKGQEALSASIGSTLRKGDIFAPLIRDGAGRLAFGETVLDAVRTCLGSPLGPMRARDGNVHRGKPREGYFPMISHLGAMLSVVNGALMAKRFKGIKNVVGATCIGEGGTSTGAWHEGLNQAAVERLPLVLIVADNQYAYSTPKSRQFACDSIVDRAPGYGVTGHVVDATNLEECLEVVGRAVDNARSGGGPQLVVGNLLRLCGHGEHDDAGYIDAKLKESCLGRDSLEVAQQYLIEKNWLDASSIERLRSDASSQVEEAVGIVQREPMPDPYKENWSALSCKHLTEGHLSEQEEGGH